MEDLESLKTYKIRLTVVIDGNSAASRSTDWLTFTTNKEPYNVALLNSAVKRDDGIKVRTILTTENVRKVRNFKIQWALRIRQRKVFEKLGQIRQKVLEQPYSKPPL